MCYKGYNLSTRLLVYSFTKNSIEAPLVRGETEDIYESY